MQLLGTRLVAANMAEDVRRMVRYAGVPIFRVGNLQRFNVRVLMLKDAFRVHVPKHIFLWPQSTWIGTTLRPKYVLYGYKDP